MVACAALRYFDSNKNSNASNNVEPSSCTDKDTANILIATIPVSWKIIEAMGMILKLIAI